MRGQYAESGLVCTPTHPAPAAVTRIITCSIAWPAAMGKEVSRA